MSNESMMTKVSRRRFQSMLAMASTTPALHGLAQTVAPTPEPLFLHSNGWMPNNTRLPVLLYRNAIPTGGDTATRMETLFRAHGWPPQWRNGVYTFHHYHSTAHELLGFAAGEAHLVLGGEGGHAITVRAGDVALLPTGTGHCEISCSDDFLVIGAYPPDQNFDICRSAPDADARKRMDTLPFPKTDPITGRTSPLLQHWKYS